MTRGRLVASSRRGSTLTVALLLVSGAALMSVITLQRGLQQWQLQAASSEQKLAFYMAEAGLADAFDDLRSGGSGNIGTKEVPATYGSGAFWVESVEDEDQVVFIESTGLFQTTAVRLSQAVQKPKLPIGEYGFFGEGGVVVGENVTISLREGAGEEEEVVEEPPVDETPTRTRIALPVYPTYGLLDLPLLGSDGGIDLQTGVSVLGDAIPGPGGLVTQVVGSLLSGSSLPEEVHRTLPAIAMPVLDSKPNLSVAANTTQTLATGTHGYGTITVAGRGVLTIEGPASIAVSSLIVQRGGKLSLDTSGGPVHFYVEDFFGLDTNSLVENTSGDASDAIFVIEASATADHDGDGTDEEPVEWLTTRAMTAAIYAPNAKVTVPVGATFQGCITALELEIGDDCNLVYDERTRDVDIRGRDYVILSWRTIEIPPDVLKDVRRDLVATAVARGDTPQPAATSRIPATDTFSFTTPEGDTLTYRGNALSDLTAKVVDAVVPAVVKVAEVPEFTSYEKDTGEDRADPEALFQAAFRTLCGYVPTEWATYLRAGTIPTADYQAVYTDGILIEPFRTALKDPALRADLIGYVAASDQPAITKRFLAAAIGLYP
ncbi:MAG: hypothetical protein R3F34_06015 [Planctomycetota bacterium]